jgi:hypothetical protein
MSYLTAFLAVVFGVTAMGCSSSTGGDGSESGDEQDIVPTSAKTAYDQAAVCAKILDRHKTIKDPDLKDGYIRWACGDVPGVTGVDRGQEYCEYNAVSGGKVVKTAAELKAGTTLSCVFTSVYQDVKGVTASSTGYVPSAETIAYGKKIATALAAKENLGVTTDPALTEMHVGFNSRGAATDLVQQCAAKDDLVNEMRQVACWQAGVANPANASKLKTLCRGRNLVDEARWAKVVALGAKIVTDPKDPNFETQHDIAGCVHTIKFFPTTAWRNSDPTICARVTRATNECGCGFVAIPDAVEGFTFTGWTNSALPAGCRYAKMDGKDYQQVVICQASTSELEDLPLNPSYSGDLQEFCHQRFANDLVMRAPLRALQTPGSCKSETSFCSAYAGTGWK